MPKAKKPTPKRASTRFIDTDRVKTLVAELHMLQLEELLSRLRAQVIEPSEMKLIWEMVKAHNLGIDGVEDLVRDALAESKVDLNDLEFDESWGSGL